MQRLVNLVTDYTISKLLLFHVRFMTVQAVRLVTVFIVTERTVNLCMRAWHSVNHLDNTWMTGVACTLDIVTKCDLEGLMRIGMATEAVVQLKMGFSFMAVSTFGN